MTARSLDPVVRHIEAHLSEPLHGADLAALCSISPGWLCRAFKEAHGQTVTEYIVTARMEQAKKLLCNPRLKMAEVAERCGYEDPCYFTRVFRRVVGIAPSSYRAMKMAAPKLRRCPACGQPV